MKGFDDAPGVRDAVEKIGVAESDVLRAGFDLLANVGKNNLLWHDAELTGVNRNDRAMAAEVFAAARGFGVTGDAVFVVGKN